jgi:hypothetical protein
MGDKLDDFIRENRAAFDDKEPPESVWNNVKATLPMEKGKPWYDNLLMWRAAAVLFMATSIYLMVPKLSLMSETNSVAVREFNDVEAFYTGQISQKVALIEQITRGDDAEAFTQDFQQLEAMYLVLKEEWKTSPSKKVKDAMVLNLLIRINLLNEHLHRLEEELQKENVPDSADAPSSSTGKTRTS